MEDLALYDIARRQAAAGLLIEDVYDEGRVRTYAARLVVALSRLEPGDRLRRIALIDARLGLRHPARTSGAPLAH